MSSSSADASKQAAPPAWLIVVLLLGGVTLILILNYVFTIGADRVDYGDIFDSTTAGPFIRQIFLPHLTIAVLTSIVLTRYGMWSEIRLNLPRGKRGWVLAVAGIAAVASVVDYGYFGDNGGPWGGVAALLAFAMVGINEELLFRGFGLAAFTRHKGVRTALILSSVCFGFAHASNLFLGQSLPSTIGQVVATTFIGLGFGIFTLLTRSLIAPMILHCLWDFMIVSRSGETELTGALAIGGVHIPVVLAVAAGLAVVLVLQAFARATTSRNETDESGFIDSPSSVRSQFS